jgi:hypothetical protein
MPKTEITQKKVDVGGVEYTLQMVPAEWYLDLSEECQNEFGRPNQTKLAKAILENIVISPKKTVNDFTGDLANLMELIKKADRFVKGLDGSQKNAVPPPIKNTTQTE